MLSLADGLVQAGHIKAEDWGEMLGAELRRAAARGAPDTDETYYGAALTALETATQGIGIDATMLDDRQQAWKAAYLRTPHGQPVLLGED